MVNLGTTSSRLRRLQTTYPREIVQFYSFCSGIRYILNKQLIEAQWHSLSVYMIFIVWKYEMSRYTFIWIFLIRCQLYLLYNNFTFYSILRHLAAFCEQQISLARGTCSYFRRVAVRASLDVLIFFSYFFISE